MRRKTLLNRNVIIVLMLFIFLMTAFVSTAYSLWYFPDSGNPRTVNTDMKVDDIEENFKNKDTYGSYLKIIDCRDGVIPTDADFAKSESGFLDNSINFTDNGNIFKGKDNKYSKKVFGVSSSKVNALYKYPFKGEYALKSFVSSVFYRLGTSITSSDTSVTDMTEIYLYDLLNSQYKLVDHLTNESIELIDRNPSSDKSYSSTKFEDYREKIGYSFSKSRILFLVPRDTKWINNKQPETLPEVDSNYNIYFHSDYGNYSKLDHVWLWNDRTDFGVSLPLNKDKSLHINYWTLYKAWNCDNSFNDTNEAGFIMTPQTAPTGIIFKTNDGTELAPKDTNGKTEYLALPLPPENSTSFNIYINADKDNGKFTISTDSTNPDVDLTKNKNIVFYSASGLDHLWMWPSGKSALSVWISSNYVYKFDNMTDCNKTVCNKTVSCFSYNYGEKFNFYKQWKGPVAGLEYFSQGFTFDKNYNYNQLQLVNYNGNIQTGTIDISGLFNGTSECTSVYLIVNDKNKVTKCTTSKSDFIDALNQLN